MTVDFACSSRLHTASFFSPTPYPGTAIWQMLSREIRDDFLRCDQDGLQYHHFFRNLTAVDDETIFRILRIALLRFYLNPGRLTRILKQHPRRTSALFLGARALIRKLVKVGLPG